MRNRLNGLVNKGVAILAITVLFAIFALPAKAVLTYSLEGVSGWPNQAHYDAAVAAIQAVTNRYNAYAPNGFNNYNVYVYYDSGIPTAQSNWGGSIGFGGTYPAERVMQHEMAHFVGLPDWNTWDGTSSGLMAGGVWQGALADQLIQQFEGDGAELHGDGIHFWPYGLNYDSEWSELAGQRQVAMVYAMRGDMGIGPTAHPSSATTVTLTASDSIGTSGFNYKDKWSDGYFAHSGAAYSTGAYDLRTPSGYPSWTFAGDSLTVNSGGRLLYNSLGTDGVITIDNLILNGGTVRHDQNLVDRFRLDGNVTLASNSTFDAGQGNIDVYSMIGGTGSLTKIGNHTLTLTGNNGYRGNTVVSTGTLELSGAGTTGFSTTTVSSGAVLGGNGTVRRTLNAQAGSTIRVGGSGLPSSYPGGQVLLDNFDSYDNTADTHTTAATGGVWQAEFDGTNNSHVVDVEPSHGQALQTKGGAAWRGAKRSLTGTGAAVEVDETQTYFWQVKASWSGGSTTDWVYDFMMGLSPDVSNIDQYNAYQDFSVMPFINNAPDTPYINAEGPGTWWAPMNPDEWYNVWVVVDNDATDPTFDLYYSVESDPNNPVLVVADANWRNFSAGLDLNAIGFMAAGYDGSSFLIDNIYYIPGASTDNPLNQTAVPVGETMTVQGNLDIQAGATLAMDIYSPTVHDMLDVQGNFTAAGTLQVTLDAGAPALQQGDLFDLMDVAGTTGGAFDSFSLPSLSTGLVWNITDLITTGELSVVVDVDLDNDGDVDGGDFLLIQQTDPSLVSAWQSLFGSKVVAGTSTVPAGTAVPEPTSIGLCLLAAFVMLRRCVGRNG